MTTLLAGILIGIVGRDLWPSVRRRDDRNDPGADRLADKPARGPKG